MPNRRRKSPQSLPSDADQIVRGGTRARHGGSNTGRLINVGGALRMKKRLSEDYRLGRPVMAQKPLAHKQGPEAEALSDPQIETEAFKGVRHFIEHGDSRRLNMLVQRLRSRVKRERLVRWCMERAPLRRDAENAQFRKLKRGSCIGQLNPSIGPET